MSQDPVDLWMDAILGRPVPSFRQISTFVPGPTASEQQAERTTQVARQIIGADKEQRQADRARLRQARLEKEAQGRLGGALDAPTRQQSVDAG